VYTIAGTGKKGYNGGEGGPATAMELAYDYDVALDSKGNLYISDGHNNLVRKVDSSTGIVTTVVGSYAAGNNASGGYSGDGGPASSAGLFFPVQLSFDCHDNLYIAEYSNSVIRMVNATTQTIQTIAGIPLKSLNISSMPYTPDGAPAVQVLVNHTTGVMADGQGNVLFGDLRDNVVRTIVGATGAIATVAGNYSEFGWAGGYSGDGGLAISAGLFHPAMIAKDSYGNVYFTDARNHVVRKIDAYSGTITTVAGNHSLGGTYSGDGGLAVSAGLNVPSGLAFDSIGNLYIGDTANNLVRKVDRYGFISTVAGDYSTYNTTGGGPPTDGSAATGAGLRGPSGLVIDPISGNLYIADVRNNVVLKVVF
jgi:hypothetical protein